MICYQNQRENKLYTSSAQHYMGLVNFSTYAHEISKLCRQSPGASSVFMFCQSHYQQVDYAKQAIQTSLHFLDQDACFEYFSFTSVAEERNQG